MVSGGVGRVVRGAFWLGLGSLAVSVLGVVFWFVVAWRFGAVGVGVAGGEVGVAGVVAGLLNFGFGQYVLRGVPLRGRGAFWDGFLASVVVGVAGGFVVFVLGYGWGGAFVPLMLCGGPVVGGLVAVGDYVSVFVFQVFGALLKVGLVLAGVGALPAVFWSMLVSSVLGVLLVARRLGFGLGGDWRGVFVVSAGNYWMNFSMGFATSLGVVLVGRVAGPGEAGVFYLAGMAVLVVSSFSSGLATVGLPLTVSGDGGVLGEGARIGAGLTLLGAVAAVPVSAVLFPLLGRDFSVGPLVYALAAPSAVMASVVSVAGARLNAEARWRELVLLGLLNAVSLGVASAVFPLVLPGIGSGLALTAGSIPGCLVALRYVSWRLGWVVVLGLFMPLAGWMLGPLLSVPLVLGLLAVLHLMGVLRVGEVYQLARIVVKMF
jgi:O-antigen/teichoic acid export membrane protein